jgi:hypothetical protein
MDLIKTFIALIISFYSTLALAQTKLITPNASAPVSNNQFSEIYTFKDCVAYLKEDSLVLENSLIKRIFRFNHGNLSTCLLINKQSGKSWPLGGNQPDFSLPFIPDTTLDAAFKVQTITETPQHAAHLEAEVIITYKDFKVKRVFRIYPATPAIACDTYLKGTASRWRQMANTASQVASGQEGINKVVIDHLPLTGNNWEVKSVEFFDATDHNNNLVQEYSRTAYKSEVQLRGNLLLLNERPSEEGLFWLKEAPVSGVQLYYPGFDFSVRFNDFKAIGVGIAPGDLSDQSWIRGYSIVTGIAYGGEEGAALALRTYQQNLKPANPEVDNMIMLNTWGDRGQDKNINESFILNEIELGSKLGITHLQMDDGWQTGRSGASAFGGGSLDSIWRNTNYWKPDSHKFPNGFGKILAAAKKEGITISTWFNPSTDNSFKNWRKDAAVLINQYKEYGIHVWKIDGVRIEDKQAEINFRKMLDSVVESTSHQAVFNLDVTAGKRFGYNYFYEYGNLFLENRYTDFASYYPHFTLRNLWMLSKYLPPQRLQIEFLNKWRNTDKYPPSDPFAPERYSFDYLFAITMPAQPLAWMEARNLPQEAFNTAKLIKTYKKYWKEWHSGQIFPIGEEPSGISWTGFQSVLKDKSSGYVLVFREITPRKEMIFELSQLPAGKYKFELIAGYGKNFKTAIQSDDHVKFTLSKERSFAFYRYELIP